jgi:hypothetical protein
MKIDIKYQSFSLLTVRYLFQLMVIEHLEEPRVSTKYITEIKRPLKKLIFTL